jgi:hypothetical protein
MPERSPRTGRYGTRRNATRVVSVVLVVLVVLIPIGLGFFSGSAPAPAGGVNPPGDASADPTVAPGIQKALKEMARREAAQRYCDAHPEAAATHRCLDGV